MKCKFCGAEIDPAVIFCPSCGKSIDSELPEEHASLEEHSPPTTPTTPIQNKTPFWFKALVFLGVLGSLIGGYMLMVNEDPLMTIEGQLKALHRKQVTEAYYSFTSKDFRNNTSLERFKEFIQAHPIFSEDSSFSYKEGSFNKELGTVVGELTSPEGKTTEVQYQLVWADKHWRIQGIELLDDEEGKTVDDKQLQDEMKAPVEQQLNALKQQDWKKAYEGLVSEEFSKETPFEKFKAFIKEYSLLTNFTKVEYENFVVSGNKGELIAHLESDGEPVSVEYKLIKEDNQWKIWGLRIILPHSQDNADAHENEDLKQLVTDQLTAIKKGNTKESYHDYVSDEFKTATPYQKFDAFIKKYPALTQYSKINVSEPVMEQGAAKIKVQLQYDDKDMALEYLLGRENQKWKIWGIQVLKKPKSEENTDSKEDPDHQEMMKPLQTTVEHQLESIRKEDYEKAYKDDTSEEFQKVTPFSKFEKFIKNQPAFKNNLSLKLNKLSFDNNVAILTGTLTNKDKQSYSVEYNLIQENGAWKIVHIQILPSTNEVSEEALNVATPAAKDEMKFTKIILSNEIDLQSRVMNPTTTLKHDSGDIFVNVYMTNGKKGNKVELDFEHVESNSRINPISTTLPEDGTSMISFVFSPPTHGWPRGHYRILAKGSTGEKKVVEFKVE